MWAAEWYSKNRLDGERRHLLRENCLPVLFKTRAQCRQWIKDRFAYIATRKDLRAEPHGWRLPRAVKVDVVKLETTND